MSKGIYTRAEVALRNTKSNCWLVVFGRVFDLSPVLADAKPELCEPILLYAGGDVSHWFTRRASDGLLEVRTRIDPATGRKTPYCPEGRFVDVWQVDASTAEPVASKAPWWQDEKNVVGRITSRPRKLRILNTLTSQEHVLEVGDEATVGEIQEKFLEFNAHCESYTWKASIIGEFRPLDPRKTLPQNGVADDTPELERLGMDADDPTNMVTLVIFFNDDLTVA